MECDDDDTMKNVNTDARDTSLSPMLSEIDELDPSECVTGNLPLRQFV